MNNFSVQPIHQSAVMLLSGDIINTLTIRMDVNVNDYIRDPSGLQTLTASYESLSPHLIEFSLPRGANHHQIQEILRRHGSLSPQLTSDIAHKATEIDGLFDNTYVLNLVVKLTYERVNVLGGEDPEDDDVVGRLVMEGKIDDEISKSLGLESEACSICFENLSGKLDKAPTRMSCSHVFHDRCISQWLRRKNSCPLCREVLYDSR